MFGFGLPSLSTLGILAGVVGVVIFGAVAWNIKENASIKAETRKVVEAEAERRTFDAINSVSGRAESARAKLRYCSGLGKLYDFAADKCE